MSLHFFSYSIKVSKFRGSCKNIHDLSEKFCVPDVIKNIHLKVFNLMSRTNGTKHIEWHEACKCKWKIDACVCNNKQCWNEDNADVKGICDKRFIWKPSNCDCECDKSCYVGEYLDHKSCNCRNKLIDKLVEEYSKNNDENEMVYNGTFNDFGNVCNFCTKYILLFVIAFLIIIDISSAFICFHWYLKKENTIITNIN